MFKNVEFDDVHGDNNGGLPSHSSAGCKLVQIL